MKTRIASIVISSLLATSCSTIVNGTDQDLKFTSSPTNASCVITDRKGRTYQVSTPGKVSIPRSRGFARVLCTSKQASERETSGRALLDPSITDWTWGNLAILFGYGAAVDYLTGAAWEYPETTNVRLIEK